MRPYVLLALVAAGLAPGLFTGPVRGQDAPWEDHPPCRPDYFLPVAPWARPSDTPHYDGYYVGGACLLRGDPRGPLEGVWGWDYEGCCFSRRVWLGWCHCRRYQGGTGAYKTDGPPLPSLHHLKKPSE